MIRDILLKDAFTVIILSLIIIITLIKYNNHKKFNSLLKIFWNSSYLKKYKYEKITYYPFDYFLQINFVISLGLFVFIYNVTYNGNRLSFNFLEFLDIIQIIVAFLVLKNLTELVISWFFNIQWLTNLYLNEKINYNSLIGLIILPINVLILYFFNPSINVLFIFIYIILLLKLAAYINSFILHQKTIKKSWFYFILYLCTLEIIPYLLLYNFFLSM
ncbi:uncharacterized protein METZ01_LOCUS155504 [marine metagenome]|uniref:DUF4271 domain-containing protein n=1 Tax=marine metagenome TaxID=408172 RepID=A0A382AM84_9ZZZZ